MVPLGVVRLTAEIVASKGSQIPHAVDYKFGVFDVVFFGETMKERCCRIDLAAAVDIVMFSS